MGKLNQVQLIGNLGDDIKLHAFENGDCAGRVSLATSSKYKNKAAEVIEETQWHNLVFRNKAAELIEKYCKKGSKLYVSGNLRYRTYEKDGTKQYFTEIHVNEFEFLDSKGDSSAAASKPESQGNPKPAPTPNPEEDDDLPF
jgi:single-strand DNA-binding protein